MRYWWSGSMALWSFSSFSCQNWEFAWLDDNSLAVLVDRYRLQDDVTKVTKDAGPSLYPFANDMVSIYRKQWYDQYDLVYRVISSNNIKPVLNVARGWRTCFLLLGEKERWKLQWIPATRRSTLNFSRWTGRSGWTSSKCRREKLAMISW